MRRRPRENGFRVRTAREDDAAGVLALARAILEEGAGMVRTPEELTTTVEEERALLGRYAETPDRLALVAEADGEVVGFLDFRSLARRRLAHVGHFGLSVRRDRRRQGVGAALLRRLLAWADANPRIEKVALSVLAGNEAAIALYRKFGFREEGRRVAEVKYSDGRYEDDVLMYRLTRNFRAD